MTETTTSVFVPIDGFTPVNGAAVGNAREEPASLLSTWFGARVQAFLPDRTSPSCRT
ncbi:MAG: hypothetical protein M0Z41_05360 [Peptococcaceae bacterium]|jgi:hypothetical protein|nr:hypothetical protein [Peptococcaceae bacterium]